MGDLGFAHKHSTPLRCKRNVKVHIKNGKREKRNQLGCRYLVLLDLLYFKPIEMLLIDAMHSLFWALHCMFQEVYGLVGLLNAEALFNIESRLTETVVRPGLGRIPVGIS